MNYESNICFNMNNLTIHELEQLVENYGLELQNKLCKQKYIKLLSETVGGRSVVIINTPIYEQMIILPDKNFKGIGPIKKIKTSFDIESETQKGFGSGIGTGSDVERYHLRSCKGLLNILEYNIKDNRWCYNDLLLAPSEFVSKLYYCRYFINTIEKKVEEGLHIWMMLCYIKNSGEIIYDIINYMCKVFAETITHKQIETCLDMKV